MNPTEQIALWADRLRDLSAMAMELFFAKSVHDEIAYRDVLSIAMGMMALVTGESLVRHSDEGSKCNAPR